MKPIGGYFSLELNRRELPCWLINAVHVNSSRHALEYVIKSLPQQIRLVHIPYYTCEVVIEPIKRLGLKYQFYHINDRFEIDSLSSIAKDEIIVVNNYFGIKDDYINRIIKHYGDQIIIDNAQAFYHRVEKSMRAIYSPRKFFGVPDGGYALTPDILKVELAQDYSTDRASHLFKRLDVGAEEGYKEFQINDASLSAEPLKAMSNLTKHLLESIDYEGIKDKRCRNFKRLHAKLSKFNKIRIPDMATFECPLVYPFLSDNKGLRQKLIDNKIFVATYWPNVLKWCEKDSIEYQLTKNIIPLPIDQRYNSQDMDEILSIVLK